MSTPLTPEQRGEVAYAFLEAGVPSTAVAKALTMDVEHVAAARSQMLVGKYGTDEKAEAMDWLIWEAYEEAVYQVRHGTPANKARFIAMILSRSVGIAGRSTPELGEKIRAGFAALTADLSPDAQLTPSIYDPAE